MKKVIPIAFCILLFLVGCQKPQANQVNNPQSLPSQGEIIAKHNISSGPKIGQDSKNTEDNSSEHQITEINTKTENDKIVSSWAIFQYNDQLYLYDEANKAIKLIENAGTPCFSGDRKKFAYLDNDAFHSVLKIYDHESRKTVEIKLDEHAAQVTSIKWHTDDLIILESSINPSTSGLYLFDSKEGKKVNFCAAGEFYQILSDNLSMLYSEKVHFSPPQNDNIQLNGSEIYRAYNVNDRVISPVVSEDLKLISFWEYVDSDKKMYFVLADMDLENKKISNIKRITIIDDPKLNARFDGDSEISGKSELISETILPDFKEIAFWIRNNEGSYVAQSTIDLKSKKIGEIQKYPVKYKGNGRLEYSNSELFIASNGVLYPYKSMSNEELTLNSDLEQLAIEEGDKNTRFNSFADVVMKHFDLDTSRSNEAARIVESAQWGK